jgi:DUF971 family protein
MTTKGPLLRILGQPDPNEPKDVHLVGRYALGVTWGDQHSSIYPFEQLRRADADDAPGEAPETPLTQAQTWPRDIKKLPEGLRVTWSDGHQSLHPYPALRAGCRCAGCTGGH